MTQAMVFTPFLAKSVERGEDGSPRAVLVTGKVTGDQLDLDKQIVDKDWARTAIAEWYQRAANVREMHQPSAVGKGIEWREEADGLYLTARISDPGAVRKVIEGVYTGFSIGIKGAVVVPDPNAPRGRIKGGVWAEISTVDAPCLPSATYKDMTPLWKMADGGDEEPDGELREAEGDGVVKTAIEVAADGVEREVTLEGVAKAAPPTGYPADPALYGDPARFAWPLDTPGRVRSAMAFFNGGRGQSEYDVAGWQGVGERIAAKAAADFGGTFTLAEGIIVHGDAEKVVDRETLVLDVPVLVKGDGAPVIPNARWLHPEEGGPVPIFAETTYKAFPGPRPAARGAFVAPATAQREGQGEPPAPATGAGTSTPNGEAGTGPGMAASFSQPAAPHGAPTAAGVTARPASELVVGAAGFAERAAQLVKDLGTAGDSTGSMVRALLHAMLAAEVAEDGGSGRECYDIKNISAAYAHYCDFAVSEAYQHEGSVPLTALALGKGLTPGSAWDALLAAVLVLRPADATAGVEATKGVADDRDADTDQATIVALTKERDELQKQLAVAPLPGGPQRFAQRGAQGDKGETPQGPSLDEQRASLLNQLGDARDPETKRAIADRLYRIG